MGSLATENQYIGRFLALPHMAGEETKKPALPDASRTVDLVSLRCARTIEVPVPPLAARNAIVIIPELNHLQPHPLGI